MIQSAIGFLNILDLSNSQYLISVQFDPLADITCVLLIDSNLKKQQIGIKAQFLSLSRKWRDGSEQSAVQQIQHLLRVTKPPFRSIQKVWSKIPQEHQKLIQPQLKSIYTPNSRTCYHVVFQMLFSCKCCNRYWDPGEQLHCSFNRGSICIQGLQRTTLQFSVGVTYLKYSILLCKSFAYLTFLQYILKSFQFVKKIQSAVLFYLVNINNSQLYHIHFKTAVCF